MRIHHLFSGLVAPALAGTLAAQAPRITPAGDPSVKADTIYRLAVDPAQHKGDDFVYLLDDGVLRFEADGRGVRTYRQIVQILTREGAERWGEQSFGYRGGDQKLTVNWIKVVRPDGTLISDKPTGEQESLAPVALEAPVYTDAKVRRVSIGGIAPGTLLDFSWTTEELKPVLPGDFYTGWRVTTGLLVRRSRLILDVPEKMSPRIRERNWRHPRPEQTVRGRRVYTWAANDVPALEGEPFAASPNSEYVGITIAGTATWSDIARWYAQLSRDRYQLTPSVVQEAGAAMAGAATREDSLRALHRWVAQDFRYVSLSWGVGGYRPRLPASVLDTRYGDCKDKATLFVALARRMGVQAHPVLLSSTAGVERELPSIAQFDHMIAAVARPDSGYLFVDLTSDLTPWGELPPAEQGGFALVVHPDGRGEEVTLPEAGATANRAEVRIAGELLPDGVFRGRYTVMQAGSQQYSLRDAYSREFTADERRQLARAIANNVFQGSAGDSLELFAGRDLTVTPRISLWISGGVAAQRTGDQMILKLPIRSYANASLVTDLEGRPTRRFPIDVAEVVGPVEVAAELRLRLPDGWRARLPDGVSAESEFGSYRAEYRQEGQELIVRRRMAGQRGVEPPEKIGALIAWLREMAKDDVTYVVLERVP
jgi:transglutaminase-like putative cysteine protease